MYKITYKHAGGSTENILYQPDDVNRSLLNCVLKLETKKSGQLEMTIPTSNVERSSVRCLTDEIIFYRNNMEIWRGRAITSQEDFFKTGQLLCEGCLSYFYDTWYPPFEFEGSPSQLFNLLIQNHNVNVEQWKRFSVGNVTVTDPNNNIVRSYEKFGRTLDLLNEKLQNSTLGGYMRVRVQNGTKYIDYINDYSTNASQEVTFGENIIDIAQEIDYGTVATVLLPVGAKGEAETDEEGNVISDGAYTTVEEVNNGSIYVKNQSAIDMYGWICDCIEWSDVTEPSNLLTKARAYLETVIAPIKTITVNFVDLATLGQNVTSFFVGDKIRVYSQKHGIDQRMMLTYMEIHPTDPAADILTFGKVQSLTDTIRNNSNSIEGAIDQERKDRHSASEALQRAIAEGQGAYFTQETAPNGGKILYMHDKKTVAESQFVVRINSEAVGFSTDGGKTYPYGLTVDGNLVMDVIESNGIRADWVYFTNQDITQRDETIYSKIASLVVDNGNIRTEVSDIQKDVNGKITTMQSSINQFAGEIELVVRKDSSGKLRLGTNTAGTAVVFTVDTANFSLTENGTLTCKNANITGTINATAGSFNNLQTNTGYYVHDALGTSNQAGYIRIATIKVTGTYCDSPIRMLIAQRTKKSMCELTIKFDSSSTTDPELGYFYYTGEKIDAYLYKTSASTWYLYVSKTGGYDHVCVMDFNLPVYDKERCTITWSDVMVTSLPSGYTKATAGQIFAGSGLLDKVYINEGIYMHNPDANRDKRILSYSGTTNYESVYFEAYMHFEKETYFDNNIDLEGKIKMHTWDIVAEGTSALYFGPNANDAGVFGTVAVRGDTVRLYSHSGGKVYLGSSGSTAITSDENLKVLSDIDDRYVDFFNAIEPVKYMYKVGHRQHLGFGARAIEKALLDSNLTTEEFAGVVIDKDYDALEDEVLLPDGQMHFDTLYSLRYEEFIALNTLMIKKCQEEIEKLKEVIS